MGMPAEAFLSNRSGAPFFLPTWVASGAQAVGLGIPHESEKARVTDAAPKGVTQDKEVSDVFQQPKS
jgi:hypothetical protein